MIASPDIPLRHYNYIRDMLASKYHQKVSLPTVIDRAKKHGFSGKRKTKNNPHDLEVHTNYVGEIIQHDSSHHLFSPPGKEKWYLITSFYHSGGHLLPLSMSIGGEEVSVSVV
jgi:hypothetical protein